MNQHVMALCGFAMLSALAGGPPPKPRPRRYSSFCGPIYPTTRQQRRAMERIAGKRIA